MLKCFFTWEKMTRCPDETRATNSIGNTTSSLNELRPLESAIMKDPLLNEILKAELDRKKKIYIEGLI